MNGDIVRNRHCSICNEIFGGQEAGVYYEYTKQNENFLKNRILYEDNQFVIVPSLGPIADYHLLVVPKEHVCSYALLDEKRLQLAEVLIEKTARFVEKKYGSCIIFEHGTLEEGMQSSASCTHAHMHIVSCTESILPRLKKDKMEIRTVERLEELKEQGRRKKPYFYYRESQDYGYVMDDIIQKSQYIRILVANALGTPQKGDWKKNPGICAVDKMLKEIKKDGGWDEFNCSSRSELGNWK